MSVGAGRPFDLAVANPKIMLRVLENRFDPAPKAVRPNDVGTRGGNLVRHKVLDRVVLVLILRDFLRNDDLLPTEL